MDLTIICYSLKMIHYSKKNMYLADDENCLCIVPNKSFKLMCGMYNLKRTNENNKDSSITSIIGNCFEKEPAPATFSFQKSMETFSSSDSQT